MADLERFQVVVVGAGPAGLAAACAAAEAGRSVAVVDDNPDLGGQIWRGDGAHPSSPSARRWFARVRRAGIQRFAGHQMFAHTARGTILAEAAGVVREFAFDRLILATGARELFLPFPGWTLPGVAGVGGLQALVKSGMPIAGKRVVVAGSGPLLVAAAACLRGYGADVRLIAEQASWRSLAGFGLHLAANDLDKIRQGLGLKRQLLGVPYRPGMWPVRAEAGTDGTLAAITLTDGRREWTIACDWLACAFGLVPNIEPALVMGCAVRAGAVAVDEFQRTGVADVLCAGEPTGIGGLELSLAEGEIAGLAAADRFVEARRLFAARAHGRRFAAELARAFALRDELRRLPAPETIVCRCEDVPLARVAEFPDAREAKLQTRCGMGPCQGRVCGPAIEFLLGSRTDSVRPPVLPVPMSAWAQV